MGFAGGRRSHVYVYAAPSLWKYPVIGKKSPIDPYQKATPVSRPYPCPDYEEAACLWRRTSKIRDQYNSMIGSPHKSFGLSHILVSAKKAAPRYSLDVSSRDGLLRVGFLKTNTTSYKLE